MNSLLYLIKLCIMMLIVYYTTDNVLAQQNPSYFSSITYKLHDCNKLISYRGITAYVPKEIDLSDDKTAKLVLEKAANMAQEKCPTQRKFDNISVALCVVDPSRKDSSDRACGDVGYYAGYARNYSQDQLSWHEYDNKLLNARLLTERQSQAAKQRQLEEDNKRREIEAYKAREESAKRETQAREEAEKRESKKKFEEFVKKNNVQDWPNLINLSTNPFVFEGKTVAIASFFEEMLTATDGLFRQGNKYFVVSSIPKGSLTAQLTTVVAGNVIGKKETKVRESGTQSIPHLSFVGMYICQKNDCSDILKK